MTQTPGVCPDFYCDRGRLVPNCLCSSSKAGQGGQDRAGQGRANRVLQAYHEDPLLLGRLALGPLKLRPRPPYSFPPFHLHTHAPDQPLSVMDAAAQNPQVQPPLRLVVAASPSALTPLPYRALRGSFKTPPGLLLLSLLLLLLLQVQTSVESELLHRVSARTLTMSTDTLSAATVSTVIIGAATVCTDAVKHCHH